MNRKGPLPYLPSTYSHQEALAYAAAQAFKDKKDIVEYGIGFGSTPMLHGLTQAIGGHLYSYETDKRWLQKFLCLESSFHDIFHVKTLDSGREPVLPRSVKGIGLVFIDQGEGYTRPFYARWFLECPDFHGYVVCHDLDHIHYKHYAWQDDIFARYTRHELYDRFCPRTMLLWKE
jgi:hypothetical protein